MHKFYCNMHIKFNKFCTTATDGEEKERETGRLSDAWLYTIQATTI